MRAVRTILAGLFLLWSCLAAPAMLQINELNGFNAGGGTAITADTGWVIAGQGRAVNRSGGSTAWTSPGNITADDGSSATVNLTGAALSHWVVADTFDFSSIPASATINGIEIRTDLAVSGVLGTPTVSAVNIGKDDSTLGTQKTPATALTTTPTNYDYGGAADLWGLSISAAEVKTSTFQALVSVGQASSFTTFSCDVIWMRVTYTYTP